VTFPPCIEGNPSEGGAPPRGPAPGGAGRPWSPGDPLELDAPRPAPPSISAGPLARRPAALRHRSRAWWKA